MDKPIIITINDISIVGGAERVAVNLANALCEFYPTTLISFYRQNATIPYTLDSRITLDFIYNFGEEKHKQSSGLSKFYHKNLHKIFLSLKVKLQYKDSTHFIINDNTFFPYFRVNGGGISRLFTRR